MNNNEVYSYPKESIIVFKTTSTDEGASNSGKININNNGSSLHDGNNYKNDKSKVNENDRDNDGITIYTYKKECYRCKK